MEEKIAKLEADMKEQLECIRREMKDAIIKTQQDTMKEVTTMVQPLLMQASKGKTTVDRAIPDSGKYPVIPVFRNMFSGDSQLKHVQWRLPTPTVLVRPTALDHPPLQEDKVISMFPDTSGRASHDQLTYGPINNSTEAIKTKECIGAAPRSGRGEEEDSSKKDNKRKGHDVAKGQSFQRKNQRREEWNQSFTPLPLTYKELYARLHRDNMVRPYPAVPWNPPFPEWYNPSASCEYHSNVSGHLIEDCAAFKKLVQGLINMGVIKIGEPNISINPLPNY